MDAFTSVACFPTNFYIYRVLSGSVLTYMETVADLPTALRRIDELGANAPSEFVVTSRETHEIVAMVSNMVPSTQKKPLSRAVAASAQPDSQRRAAS
jgi:hypothetical protein